LVSADYQVQEEILSKRIATKKIGHLWTKAGRRLHRSRSLNNKTRKTLTERQIFWLRIGGRSKLILANPKTSKDGVWQMTLCYRQGLANYDSIPGG